MDSIVENNQDNLEPRASMGAISRVTTIFWEPRRVFEDLDIRATWLFPWIIISVFSLIALQFTWSEVMDVQMETLRNQPDMTAEQLELIQEKMGDPDGWGLTRILATTGAPLGILGALVVVAAGLYFAGSVLGGGNSTFKKNLAVYCHASVVGIPAAIVHTALIKTKGSMDISLSPALFMPVSMSDSVVYKLLGHLDFFTVWTYVLTCIGFSVIHNFSATKSYLSIGALWLFWILMSTAISSAFSGLGI